MAPKHLETDARTAIGPFSMRWRFAADLVAILLIGHAFRIAWVATHDRNWPGDIDFARDVAIAQGLLDTGTISDPCYPNEANWYNPLCPLLIAAVAAIFDLPAPAAAARAGAWLNLLAPIAFYLLLARVAGRLAALSGLAAFLFVIPEGAEAFSASYSAWMIPANFTQGLFYLAVLAIIRSSERWTVPSAAVAGGLAGLTFLGHTAPAILLAGQALFAVVLGIRSRRHGAGSAAGAGRILACAGVMAATAGAVAAPHLLPLLTGYGFRIRNPAPTNYETFALASAEVKVVLWSLIRLPGLVGFLGVGAWCAGRIPIRAPGLLFAWPVLAIAAGGLHYLRQALNDGEPLTEITPVHHWWYYFQGFRALGFGLGIEAVFRLTRTLTRGSGLAAWVAATGLAALPVVMVLPSYACRTDLKHRTWQSRIRCRRDGFHPAYHWLRSRTPAGAVVLAKPDFAYLLVAPAGRKTLLVDRTFSNPFVDFVPRERAYVAFEDALLAGDGEGMVHLARAWGITHLIIPPLMGDTVEAWGFQRGFAEDGFSGWSSPAALPAGAAKRVRILDPPPGARRPLAKSPEIVVAAPGGMSGPGLRFEVRLENVWHSLHWPLHPETPSSGRGEDQAYTIPADAVATSAFAGLTWDGVAALLAQVAERTGAADLPVRLRVESGVPSGGGTEADASGWRAFRLVR